MGKTYRYFDNDLLAMHAVEARRNINRLLSDRARSLNKDGELALWRIELRDVKAEQKRRAMQDKLPGF